MRETFAFLPRPAPERHRAVHLPGAVFQRAGAKFSQKRQNLFLTWYSSLCRPSCQLFSPSWKTATANPSPPPRSPASARSQGRPAGQRSSTPPQTRSKSGIVNSRKKGGKISQNLSLIFRWDKPIRIGGSALKGYQVFSFKKSDALFFCG